MNSRSEQPPWAPASDRNKAPILERLLEVMPASGSVLEIGSGWGQHVVHFAPAFPGLRWQPSERADQIDSLAARIQQEGNENIAPPIELDVRERWPDGPFDAAYSANTSHIMSWPMVECMFAGVSGALREGGLFCLYGPFNRDGEFTAPSNRDFDASLRGRDPEMGLRDLSDIEKLAQRHHMQWTMEFQMPANNLLLVFQR